MTMLLLRPEQEENRTFATVVKRLIHLFCQNVETALLEGGDRLLLPECPCPDLRSRYHPFMRHSRRCGNSTIRQSLSKDFLARGGGYVTTRYEINLKKLGLVSPKSSLGSLASSEFVARQLDMASQWVEGYLRACASRPYGLKVINFALDESRVAQQQVSCLLTKFHRVQVALHRDLAQQLLQRTYQEDLAHDLLQRFSQLGTCRILPGISSSRDHLE